LVRAYPYSAKFMLICHLGTMLIIVLLWFAINGPLVSLGAYFGTKHGVGAPSIWFFPENSRYTANTSASPCELDPSPNPTSTLLPEANPLCLPLWNSPFWRGLHRRLLSPLFDLCLTCLLRLWLPCSHICRRHSRHGHRNNPVCLLPPLC